jgi:hypothetical protein
VKIKTSELAGAALDWAVAKCEYDELAAKIVQYPQYTKHYPKINPSTDWAQGGPIIECNLITIFRHDEEWFAHSQLSTPEDFHGDTPLIAAMRCYVASILGGEVEIPKELT